MKKTFKKIWLIAINTILVLFLFVGLLVVFSFLPIKNNFKLFAVMSGSMEPTVHTGSLILSRPAESYHEGDIITFQSGKKKTETTTHRIVSVEMTGDGYLYVTKGDANDAPDLNKVAPSKVIGRVVGQIAGIGYILGYAKTLPGLLIVIILPAAIIIYDETKNIHHETKKIIAKRKEKGNEN